MTPERLAYYAAQAAANAMDAQAWRARAKADRLCPHDPPDLRERAARHSLNLAAYYDECTTYWLARLRGEDPDSPRTPMDSSGPGSSPDTSPEAPAPDAPPVQ